MKPKRPLSDLCKENGRELTDRVHTDTAGQFLKPTIYIYPSIREQFLRMWSYPALRAAFDHSEADMRDDIAAELARRGGLR